MSETPNTTQRKKIFNFQSSEEQDTIVINQRLDDSNIVHTPETIIKKFNFANDSSSHHLLHVHRRPYLAASGNPQLKKRNRLLVENAEEESIPEEDDMAHHDSNDQCPYTPTIAAVKEQMVADFANLKMTNDVEEGREAELDAESYKRIGQDFVKVINCFKTPKERRSLLSIMTVNFLKGQTSRLLGNNISKYEWSRAMRHAKYPGPGTPLPPEQKHFRKRLNDEVVASFVHWLNSKDYLQELSFGHKVVKYCNGTYSTLESVKLTKSIAAIIKDFAKEWQENTDIFDTTVTDGDNENSSIDSNDDYSDGDAEENDDENLAAPRRCKAKCKKSGSRCLKNCGHAGCHKFTQQG